MTAAASSTVTASMLATFEPAACVAAMGVPAPVFHMPMARRKSTLLSAPMLRSLSVPAT